METVEKRRQYQKQLYQRDKEYYKKKSLDYYYSHREEIRERRNKRPEEKVKKLSIYLKSWRRKVKEAVLTHYSHLDSPICKRCGITDIDVLCLDHILADGAKQKKELFGHRAGGMFVYRWVQKNDYPKGYQVLCANCNLKKKINEDRFLRVLLNS